MSLSRIVLRVSALTAVAIATSSRPIEAQWGPTVSLERFEARGESYTRPGIGIDANGDLGDTFGGYAGVHWYFGGDDLDGAGVAPAVLYVKLLGADQPFNPWIGAGYALGGAHDEAENRSPVIAAGVFLGSSGSNPILARVEYQTSGGRVALYVGWLAIT